VRHRTRKTLASVLTYIAILVMLLIPFFPLYWMVNTSFKDLGAVFAMPPQWLPLKPTLDNFKNVLASAKGIQLNFLTYFKNSLLVCTGTVILSITIATFASYAFSRFRFGGRRFLLNLVLTSQMFPLTLLLISFYIFFARIGLLNTRTGLIVINTSFALPFCVWMLKGFFDRIPQEIEEAAMIDGCGTLQALVQVVLPMALPGIFAVAVFSFMVAWDEYLFALTLIGHDPFRTLPPGIVLSFVGQFEIRWGDMMAASIIATVPVLIIFLFFQRYLIQGLTEGAVKG
jgi:multiple sugar transport system permease protein